jgi:hypothetical protein
MCNGTETVLHGSQSVLSDFDTSVTVSISPMHVVRPITPLVCWSLYSIALSVISIKLIKLIIKYQIKFVFQNRQSGG